MTVVCSLWRDLYGWNLVLTVSRSKSAHSFSLLHVRNSYVPDQLTAYLVLIRCGLSHHLCACAKEKRERHPSSSSMCAALCCTTRLEALEQSRLVCVLLL